MTLPVGQSHCLKAQFWAHPRPGLGIEELAGRMESIGNVVLDTHRGCSAPCSLNEEAPPPPNDHLLIGIWE